MRDPWFPMALMLIVLLSVWLGIAGPMPTSVTLWIQQWQTLLGALVASIAAYIAFTNTTRTLKHSEKLESNRRLRKHAAVRAVLPLALSQVTAYAEQSARALNTMIAACIGETLPEDTAPEQFMEQLPTETLESLADFIEYADNVNVDVIESTVAWIQIHESRIRGMVKDNHDRMKNRVITRTEIEGRIIDAASIYAGAASVFDYARRRQSQLPHLPSWDTIRGALRNMYFWEDEHPRLYQIIERRERTSTGPFERLNPG